MLDMTLLLGCLSLGIEPALMLAIVDQESSNNPIALNVNRWDGDQVIAESASDAAEAAGMFRDAGYTVDLGLAGINSRNLERLDVSFDEALDPCTNIALGETIFMEGLEMARAAGKLSDGALRAALSLYNTGSMTRGFENGYVASVWSRYVASDAYLGRVGGSRVEWTVASEDEVPDIVDTRSDTRSSSTVRWISRTDDGVPDTGTPNIVMKEAVRTVDAPSTNGSTGTVGTELPSIASSAAREDRENERVIREPRE